MDQTDQSDQTNRKTGRLHLTSEERILLGTLLATSYGLFHGIVRGAKRASLRYLAENAHRLPRTKGTWYFFHKRKNYVILKDGFNLGVKTGLKFGSAALLFLGTESAIDNARGRIDLAGTTGAAATVGVAVALVNRLSLRQTLRSSAGFALVGLIVGGLEDVTRWGQELAEESSPQELIAVTESMDDM